MGCARKITVSACKIGTEEWQPIRGGVYNPLLTFEFRRNSFESNVLRFTPVQIGEWLNDLLAREVVATRTALSQYVGMSRTRVGQFLALAGLPAGTRAKLRGKPDLNEYQIRGMMAGKRTAATSDKATFCHPAKV